MTQTELAQDPPMSHLRLTARLNTSALDARRGVVRLHPEAIAALGIRAYDRRGGRGGACGHADRLRTA